MKYLIILWLCFYSSIVAAHKASDSYLSLTIQDNALVEGRWDIALRDLDVLLNLDENQDRQLTWGEVLEKNQDIEQLVLSNLMLKRGQLCQKMQFQPLAIDHHVDGQYAVLQFHTQCPTAGEWQLKYQLLANIDKSHRGILQWQQNYYVLIAADTWQTLSHETAKAQTFSQFWQEGVIHIWLGYDHILFLVSLLLPVVLLRQQQQWHTVHHWRQAIVDATWIVTAFTLAHSITLVLAVKQWVYLPSRWVESVIALSVMIAALHNLWPILHRYRWLMAFVFGLIHGFGFASVLADIQAQGQISLMALFGFNAGVETGQLAIVLVLIPILYYLRHSAKYQPVILNGGSSIIVVVACLWFVERVFGIQF